MQLFNDALHFAIECHSGQVRKMSPAPYIIHPLEVSTIVATMTCDEEILAAAVLHDTVEDAGVKLDDIENRFGHRVRMLVMTETEDKREDRPAAETWRQRKEETLLILRHTKDIGVKMLWLGDKLSNMRSFYRLYLKTGNELWKNFNQKNPEEQLWYYNTISDYLSELKDYDAYKEFINLKNIVFESVNGGVTHDF